MAAAKFHFAAAVVFALLLSALLHSSEVEENAISYYRDAKETLQLRNIFDDKLMAILESFRANMTHPTDSLGLPTLEPFLQDTLPINLSLNGIAIVGELEDLNITGLSKFVIDRAHFEFVGLRIQFRFFLAVLSVSTKLNVSIADTLHISGSNTYSLEGDDLTLSGEISVGAYTTGKRNLYLKNVTLDFSYGSLKINLGNDFNTDKKLTVAVQAVLNDLLPQAVDRKKHDLLTWAESKVTALGDHLLENTTMNDILGTIG